MINAAVPPLHAWLADAYPEATITGAVFMSALTTKTAVYVLMRGYPGVELLMWMGAIMTLYGVIYAVLANDIRRILAYHIISQVGYMVCAVGMGTMLALNGAAAHAFTHILYKALLFMGAGAVIHMTGKSKLTELGGLYRYMPWTFLLYMVGALSISGFPLFSGFVSKTIIIEAAAVDHRALIYLMLLMAPAGTFLSIGLKLAWFTFLGKDSGLRPQEAPPNMLVAMGIAAFLCAFIGLFPGTLYALLPGPIDYNAYTIGHVLKELQLLLFTGLAFFLLLKYVGGKDKITLDTDWIYRAGGQRIVTPVGRLISASDRGLRAAFMGFYHRQVERIQARHGRSGKLARSWPIGSMALWTAVLLAALLIFGVRQ
jgi:multicomponent Na+:H+ antiporter subunit D